MKQKTLLKKLAFNEQDFEDIKNAVTEQEKNTSGEIVLAIAPESSNYAFWKLLTALFAALIVVGCLIPFTNQIYSYIDLIFMPKRTWVLTTVYVLSGVLVAFIVYLLYNIPAFNRRVIPLAARRTAVNNRALRHFVQSGVYKTSGQTGILIFISYFEREIRILADSGINAKVSQDLWNIVADEMTDSLTKGRVKEALLGAINRCGELLSQNFSADSASKNELPDGLVILDKESWV